MEIKRLDIDTPKAVFEQIAKLHRAEISVGLLATLGNKFLVQLYQAMASTHASAVYVAMEHQQVLGFVGCTIDSSKFFRHFLVSKPFAVVAVIPKLFSWALIKRSLSLIKYMMSASKDTGPAAELLSIVVDPHSQGRGIGKQLLVKVHEFMNQQQVEQFKVAAADTQESAQHFYQSTGGLLAMKTQLGPLSSNIYYYTVSLSY